MKEKIYNFIQKMNINLYMVLVGLFLFGSLYYGVYLGLVKHHYIIGFIVPLVGYVTGLWITIIRQEKK